VAITRILKGALAIVFWRLATFFARSRKIEGASAEVLRTYFSDSANFSDKSIEQLVQELGWWQEDDDWDFGRFFYTWIRPGFCVTVAVRSGKIHYVVFARSRDQYGSDDMVWQRQESNVVVQE